MGTRVKQMTRGERPLVHRGGEGCTGHGVRGSNDGRWDPADPIVDPCRNLRDDDEGLQDPANDEHIWPTLEEEDAHKKHPPHAPVFRFFPDKIVRSTRCRSDMSFTLF